MNKKVLVLSGLDARRAKPIVGPGVPPNMIWIILRLWNSRKQTESSAV